MISIKIYSDGCYIDSSLFGCQDGLLSYFFDMPIVSTLLPNGVLKCKAPDECFLLDVVFED